MDNEEKILEMLAKLTEKVDKMETGHGAALRRLEERVEVLDERSLKSAVLLEADVTRDLRRLYEGHGAIMEKLDELAPQDQVDEHESDISIMKDAIKLMRQELNELKKAQ